MMYGNDKLSEYFVMVRKKISSLPPEMFEHYADPVQADGTAVCLAVMVRWNSSVQNA